MKEYGQFDVPDNTQVEIEFPCPKDGHIAKGKFRIKSEPHADKTGKGIRYPKKSKTTGGKHEVIDETFREAASFKETKEGEIAKQWKQRHPCRKSRLWAVNLKGWRFCAPSMGSNSAVKVRYTDGSRKC